MITVDSTRGRDPRASLTGTSNVTSQTWPPGSASNLQSDFLRILLQPAKERLEILRNLKTNWDGRGAKSANKHLINKSTGLLEAFSQVAIRTHFGWFNPVLNLDDDGRVVMEWWRGLKKLTLYIAPAEKTAFVRIWGDDIDSEMDDGAFAKVDGFEGLWIFLNS